MTERRRPALRKFLTESLRERGMKLMQDPRVGKLMQDERVMKAAMQAFQLRGKVQEELDTRVEAVAKSLGLVTKNEVRELKRTLRKLETDLKKAQASADKATQAAERATADKAGAEPGGDKPSGDKRPSARKER